MKNAFYISSFRSWDIQFFVFLSSHLFLPVSHCFRVWSKINLKVCDVINCLNKNLITHFVWYLVKEKRNDTETLSVYRVLNKEHFILENYAANAHQRLIPDLFLILVNKPKQPLLAINSFKNKIFWKRIIKSLKKVNFIFSFEPSPF